MAFALAIRDGRVVAFATPEEAARHCKGIDVEDGLWLFFAEDGSPLVAKFERPNLRVGGSLVSGTYSLQRPPSGKWLQERLELVRAVEGCDVDTVDDLVELLKINRGKRARPRG